MSESVLKGTLVLNEFDKLLYVDGKNFKNSIVTDKNWQQKFEGLMKFTEMVPNNNVIKQRLEQLSVYLELSKVHDVANVLLQIVEKNSLNSDFFLLKDIASSVRWIFYFKFFYTFPWLNFFFNI